MLAFIAGATNAGAFLAVRQYTSHMTGMVSSLADHLVLGELALAANAFGALLAFVAGAALCAVLVNFAKRHRLSSQFATPLLLEAALLLAFGLIGAQLSSVQGVFASVTVLMLCFMMGLQNAVITKVSRAEIRTTHVTGLVTDIGIEIGKALYWNRAPEPTAMRVAADRDRLFVLAMLVLSFLAGGIIGALGFQHLGYATTLPLALLLVAVSVVPVIDDLKAVLSQPAA